VIAAEALARAGYPVRVPARFSFVTLGQAQRLAGGRGGRQQLSPAEPTIADAFSEAGYQTALVGKWDELFRRPPDYRGAFAFLIPEWRYAPDAP